MRFPVFAIIITLFPTHLVKADIFVNQGKKDEPPPTKVPAATGHNYFEECRAYFSGIYLNLHTKIKKTETNIGFITKNLNRIARAQNDIIRKHKHHQSLTSPGKYDLIIHEKLTITETRLNNLENQRKTNMDLLKHHRKRLERLNQDLDRFKAKSMKVFNLTRENSHSLAPAVPKLIFKTTCPESMPSCPISLAEVRGIIALFGPGGAKGPCLSYLKRYKLVPVQNHKKAHTRPPFEAE